MSAGMDMLHHYGPLNRSKDGVDLSLLTNKNTSNSTSAEVMTFDYQCFRQQFEELMERIINLAGGSRREKQSQIRSKQLQTIKFVNAPEIVSSRVEIVETNLNLNSEKEKRHEILNVQPMRRNTGAIRKLDPLQADMNITPQALESVEEDDIDGEDNKKDIDDLSGQMDYRKTFGYKQDNDATEVDDEKEPKIAQSRNDRTIPINEKLFSDLGIWW